MKNVNMFSAPHKALRKLLSEFSLLAGKINTTDSYEVMHLKQLGKELFCMLSGHAKSENEILLEALEKRCPGASSHDLKDHQEIEALQQLMEDQLAGLNESSAPEEWHKFYLRVTLFHSRYLQHMLDEETDTQEQLWRFFSDDELLGMRRMILAKIPLPNYLVWLKHMLQAQAEWENSQLLKALNVVFLEKTFEQVKEVARLQIPPARFHKILGEAGISEPA